MAKSENQKLKLLYIRKFLLEQTDKDHRVTTAQIIDELTKHEIKAERKSIYDHLVLSAYVLTDRVSDRLAGQVSPSQYYG